VSTSDDVARGKDQGYIPLYPENQNEISASNGSEISHGNAALLTIHRQQPVHRSDEIDPHLLEQTVEKLVRFGQQVGVTPEEMISLLDSGISIHDLLAFLASKSSGAA
jgi:acetyl-CoA acetyltransferase